MSGKIRSWLGDFLARFLEKPVKHFEPVEVQDPDKLKRVLQPGDILLVDGDTRISMGIKYLTQSTWSHAALYVGDVIDPTDGPSDGHTLIEVLAREGCIAVPFSKYEHYATRICRPVGLTKEDQRKIIDFAIERLGTKYDLRHIFDLARYLIPTPPVPRRFRRRMIALGSGDPTRAICSTLIAEAFQSVNYPILPDVRREELQGPSGQQRQNEILHIRHHSLFTPRDFDLSPYFEIVKPTLEIGFDYRSLVWAHHLEAEADDPSPRSA